MAITTTSQVLHDGVKNVVMQFTGRSDGSGQETAVVKVDVSELSPPCAAVKIRKLTYDVIGGAIQLLWDGVPPVEFLNLAQSGKFDYEKIGGLLNGADDPSGDILLSTLGFEANSSYSLTLEMTKK